MSGNLDQKCSEVPSVALMMYTEQANASEVGTLLSV